MIAVAASILTAVYHMLKNHVPYHDLGPDHLVKHDAVQIAAKLARRIKDLGYRLTMNVLVACAQFERDLLIERTESGLRRAVSQGKKLGRKPILTDTDRAVIRSGP